MFRSWFWFGIKVGRGWIVDIVRGFKSGSGFGLGLGSSADIEERRSSQGWARGRWGWIVVELGCLR